MKEEKYLAEESPKELAEEIRSVVPEIEQGTAEVLAKHIALREKISMFSGPLPQPKHLQKYEKILPGSAERLLSMLEKESAHRHGVVEKSMNASIKMSWCGMIMAFILSLIVISGGVYLTIIGKSLAGFGAIIASLVSLVVVFITRQKK